MRDSKGWLAILILSLGLNGGFSAFVHASDERHNKIKQFENEVIARMERGNPNATRWTLDHRLKYHKVPGVGVAIIENGKVIWAKGYGTKEAGKIDPVDADTVFSAGSVSKIINAALILRLVKAGKIDLDEDINHYLKRWKVPHAGYAKDKKVTLRAILSHTAGFNQHGFRDFQPDEELPALLQTLKGEPPAKHGPIKLLFTPGTKMKYSGGGITISQLLVEDVTGLTYSEAAKYYVFDPLGMTRSSFANPLPVKHGNIAKAHGEGGQPAALPRGWEAMPELAASGLWTSANDMAKFIIALLGKGDVGKNFLPEKLRSDMMTRVARSWHGLGPRLNGKGEERVFHHGGANNSYRAWIEGHLNSGDGIVILTNGQNGHWIYAELRKSAQDAFGWPVKSDGGFEEPEF